jgi:hypothetical protein
MSKDSTNSNAEQDIDFASITKGIGNWIQGLNRFLYNCIRFAIRNIIILGILIVVGAALGTYLDKTTRVYEHKMIVSPNFGSVDHLYTAIHLIDAKIKERDTLFLSKIGIKNSDRMLDISIAPIVDVYHFVSINESNYKLLELMAEDGDIKKIVADNTTSKNYTNHTISFATLGKTTNEKTVTPIINYLNSNEFYLKIQKEYNANIKIKMQQNDSIVSQINNVLGEFSKNAKSGPTDRLVYYNENTQLNDVIKTKDELIKEQGTLRLDMVSLDKIVKDISVVTNIRDDKATSGKMKLVLPIVLIMLFLMIYFFRAFYRKQSLKYSTK